MPITNPPANPSDDLASLFKGERVSHLYRDNVYYAHLSLYYFALQFCVDKVVLDAGSGAGYGSAYLADHGAKRVLGVDVSEEAVAFSREHFIKSNLHRNLDYRVLDLERLDTLQPARFDLIYSSNVLEHVPDAVTAIRQAAALLNPGGVMVIAVPPIVGRYEWEDNVMNPYHLNLWTPRQWLQVIRRFFGEAQAYFHAYEHLDQALDMHNRPEDTVIDETCFRFDPCDVSEYYRRATITALFVARRPLAATEIPSGKTKFIEGSFTRPPRRLGSPIYRVGSLREARLRAGAILHQNGPGALVKRLLGYLGKGSGVTTPK